MRDTLIEVLDGTCAALINLEVGLHEPDPSKEELLAALAVMRETIEATVRKALDENGKVQIELGVPDEAVAGALASAFESSHGCGYWCSIYGYKKPSGEVPVFFGSRAGYMSYPLTKDGALLVFENEDRTITAEDVEREPSRILRLDRAAVKRGLELMAEKQPHRFAELINQEGDAITGELFVQFCVLGEEKYG